MLITMARKHGLDMKKVKEKIDTEVASTTHFIFFKANWTWVFGKEEVHRCPTVSEIAKQYKDNLKDALEWWKKSGDYVETVSNGRLRVAVHGKTDVEYINFMVEVDSFCEGM